MTPGRTPSTVAQSALAAGLILLCFAPGAGLPGTTPAQATVRARTTVCKAANGFPDPSAEIISVGPSCARANRVLGDFFAKAQSQGSPLTVDRFRCRALPGEIECRHRRARIEYFGGM
jgi:hypothetical protein